MTLDLLPLPDQTGAKVAWEKEQGPWVKAHGPSRAAKTRTFI